MSTKMFSSNKHNIYHGESYDLKYFIASPTEEILHPTSSGSDSLESSQSQSLDSAEFDEEKLMRLKLQELERALLDEDDDLSMDVDGEWADQIGPTLHDSPKESTTTSSDSSYLSSTSSNKESSQLSPRTPKEMLFGCASALLEGNVSEALSVIDEVRQSVSIQGDPTQRIAAYMVEGLAARMAASGKYIYKSLKCKEPPSFDRLAAMQTLFEICPCFKFGFMAANASILEAIKGEKRVHIIDFDINQGNQYFTLLQTISTQSGKKAQTHLRLTGVDDPESVQRPVGGLKNIGQRLEKLAESLKINFEFQAVASRTSVVDPGMLNLRPGEAVIVNFAFQLHHMPDESVSTVNERDQLLRMVKGLNPKLVTVVEQDVNTNTAPFMPRFVEAYNYYEAVFESLDLTMTRESPDRMNVERQCLARDIVNIVACEGEERIERYEVAGKWRARMAMAGFGSRPISRQVKEAIGDVIVREYCNKYQVKEEMGSLHFGWKEKSLIVASAWR